MCHTQVRTPGQHTSQPTPAPARNPITPASTRITHGTSTRRPQASCHVARITPGQGHQGGDEREGAVGEQQVPALQAEQQGQVRQQDSSQQHREGQDAGTSDTDDVNSGSASTSTVTPPPIPFTGTRARIGGPLPDITPWEQARNSQRAQPSQPSWLPQPPHQEDDVDAWLQHAKEVQAMLHEMSLQHEEQKRQQQQAAASTPLPTPTPQAFPRQRRGPGSMASRVQTRPQPSRYAQAAAPPASLPQQPRPQQAQRAGLARAATTPTPVPWDAKLPARQSPAPGGAPDRLPVGSAPAQPDQGLPAHLTGVAGPAPQGSLAGPRGGPMSPRAQQQLRRQALMGVVASGASHVGAAPVVTSGAPGSKRLGERTPDEDPTFMDAFPSGVVLLPSTHSPGMEGAGPHSGGASSAAAQSQGVVVSSTRRTPAVRPGLSKAKQQQLLQPQQHQGVVSGASGSTGAAQQDTPSSTVDDRGSTMVVRHHMEFVQGTREWLEAREGRITASAFLEVSSAAAVQLVCALVCVRVCVFVWM